jgi:hypothetical protein
LVVTSALIRLGDQAIAMRFPEILLADVEFVFGPHIDAGSQPMPRREIFVTEGDDRRFSVIGHRGAWFDLARLDVMTFVMEAVVTALIEDLSTAVALHAGAVRRGDRAALIVGPTGAGKSSLVAWLADNGFSYMADEIALVSEAGSVSGFARALVIKPGSYGLIRSMRNYAGIDAIPAGPNHMIRPAATALAADARCALMLFVKFQAGSDLQIDLMSRATAAASLVECNLNARNLVDGGFRLLASLARRIPAISVRYGHFDQLRRVVVPLLMQTLDTDHDVATYRRLFAGFADSAAKAQLKAAR